MKLKFLLVYYSENPKSLKKIANGSLPLVWKSNSKAWVTQAIFQDCFLLSFFFSHHFIPEAEKYWLEKEVLLNTLAAEQRSVSPLFLDDFHPNVKLVQFSSIAQLSADSLPPHRLQHTKPPCPSPTPRVYQNSCPLSW